MTAERKILSFHCFVTVEYSSLRLGRFILPEDFFKGGLKLSHSSACSTDGTGNVFKLIIHVFQCLEVRCVWLLYHEPYTSLLFPCLCC